MTSGHQRPWAITPSEVRQYQLLQHLAEPPGGHPAVLDEAGMPDDVVLEILAGARARGLVAAQSSSARVGDPPQLTAAGRQWVAEQSGARADHRLRRRACQTELLLWLDRDVHGGGYLEPFEYADESFTDSPHVSFFYGEPFTASDAEAAARALLDDGLVQTYPYTTREGRTVRHVALTTEGKRCADRYGGDVGAYFDRGKAAPTSYMDLRGAQIHGPVSQGNHNTLTMTVSAAEVATVAAEVGRLKDLLSSAEDLDPDDRADLEMAIDDIEQEASQPAPDRRRILGRLRNFAAVTGRLSSDAAFRGAADESVRQMVQLVAGS